MSVTLTPTGFAIVCYLSKMYPGTTPPTITKTATELTDDFPLCGQEAAAYGELTRIQQLAVKDWATRMGISLPAAVATFETNLAASIATKQAAVDAAIADLNSTLASAESDFTSANPQV